MCTKKMVAEEEGGGGGGGGEALETKEFCFDAADGSHRVVLPHSVRVLRRPIKVPRFVRGVRGDRSERQYVFVRGVENNSPRSIREAELAASQLLPTTIVVSSLPRHDSPYFYVSQRPGAAERIARLVVRDYLGDAAAAASGQYCGRELDAACAAVGLVGCHIGFGTRSHSAVVLRSGERRVG